MKKLACIVLSLITIVPTLLYSQTAEDYKKAGWMTTRMYGGNRSGYGPNWLVMNHDRGYDFVKDADGSYDLTGGWHDCGDHVKFGQTQFYAGYVLLLGYLSFPEGYDDYYSPDYSGYSSSGDFSWEGGQGTPNGIPDILDEVKYATDYFIKCARDGSTFYSQVGNGSNDHKNWVTSVRMAQLTLDEGGEANGSRPIMKNPNDASMASFCGAALAVMSRVYRHFDAEYADLCLQHAEYAYEYASNHQTNVGGGTITGSFYGPDNKWEDNYICLCTELYLATGNEMYKTEAVSFAPDINEHNWVLDFENNDDLAAYALARLDEQSGIDILNAQAEKYKAAVNGNNVMQVGSNWGVLRYSCSAAFVVALQHAMNKDGAIAPALKGTMDYVLGFNSSNLSFIVGFGNNSPQKPHHRNVYMNDDNQENHSYLQIPPKNRQHGYLVGGSFNPSSFPDNIDNYQTSEGGIDYNSGLVGALAYIRSIVEPVDQTKFGILNCEGPHLGADQSLCGVNEIILNSNLEQTNRSFSWERDGAPLNGNTPNLTVSQAGTYKLTVDSLGCISSDQIIISAEIPEVDLGSPQVFVSDPILLDCKVTGGGLTYLWSRNGITINGASSSTFEATQPGTYAVTVSGSGCENKTGEVVISNPPSFTYTSTAPTIDGALESTYTNVYSIETLLSGNAGAPNLFGTWSGLWDETNVYLYISITDDNLFGDSGTGWYNDDGVEIFFDGGNEKATAYDNNDFQFATVYGTNSLVEGSNNQSTATGIQYILQETTNGYVVEIKIPWNTLNTQPEIGATIGFDIGINDDDNGANRENKVAWFQTTDAGWQNPSVLGEIILMPEAEEPTIQTIALDQGWNFISFNVLPENKSVASVLSSISNNLGVIKNNDGFYRPADNELFQSLQTLSFESSYLVYMNNADEIIVEGSPAVNVSVQLNEGWNMVGYPLTVETSAASVVNNTITTIKNFDGAYPANPVSSLENLLPGSGYFIWSDGQETISW